ncbi:hypothetical protein B7463_g5255, partial [Scytalidium lignicola]
MNPPPGPKGRHEETTQERGDGTKYSSSSVKHSSRGEKTYHVEGGYGGYSTQVEASSAGTSGQEARAREYYEQARTQDYSSHQTGESSYPEDPAIDGLTSGIRNLDIPTDTAYTTAEYSASAEPTSSPQQSSVQQAQHSRTHSTTTQLDPSYQVRSKDYKDFFRVGRVFSILWSEPTTANVNDGHFVSEVAYGENAFTKIRRFVVVKQRSKACSCLPVTSYEKKGVNKAGIVLADHGFIYSSTEPSPVNSLGARPLKMVLSQVGNELTDPSLVNYSKVYNVETNLKVKDVGYIDPEFVSSLTYYFNKIFNENDPPVTIAQHAQNPDLLTGVGAGFTSPSTPADSGGAPAYNLVYGSPSPLAPAVAPYGSNHSALYNSQPGMAYQPDTTGHLSNLQQQASTAPYSTAAGAAPTNYRNVQAGPYAMPYEPPRTTPGYPSTQNYQPSDYSYPNPQASTYPSAAYVPQPSFAPNTYQVPMAGTNVTMATGYQVTYGAQPSYTAPTARDDDLDLDRHAQQHKQHRADKSSSVRKGRR